ncbi:MAG: ABC transporter ATP-binding protein [Gemmatimonadota bacterium]|jgi:phospholipid/cholesterol/gamma-HCH transport system ATP-binding protein
MSIELKELHKSFGEQDVLRGFSLEVREGETLAIIGHSGAGKSVTLKSIIGLVRPDRGEVWVDGNNVHDLSQSRLYDLRRQVGYVFQFAALFDSMTIRQNVAMGLRRIRGMEEEEIQRRVSTSLRLVDLEGVEERYPSDLSGGMRKRAGLARAIATEPKYILYDEPTTGLDPVTITVIDELILRMKDELGATGVVITHDMESAYRVSDRIAMLYEGRVRFEGTPDEVRKCDDPVVKGFIEGRPELLEEAR